MNLVPGSDTLQALGGEHLTIAERARVQLA